MTGWLICVECEHEHHAATDFSLAVVVGPQRPTQECAAVVWHRAEQYQGASYAKTWAFHVERIPAEVFQ